MKICEKDLIGDCRYYYKSCVCVCVRASSCYNKAISCSSTGNKNGINRLIAKIIVYQGPNERFDELGGQQQ